MERVDYRRWGIKLGSTWKIEFSEAFEILEDFLKPWPGVILHHTWKPALADYERQKIYFGPRIDFWHKKEWKRRGYRSWIGGMGYHFFIEGDGTLMASRRWLRQWYGIHCKRRNHWIGIGVLGNFDEEKIKESQVETLVLLISELKREFPKLQIDVHRHFQPKTCPGLLITDEWVASLWQIVKRELEGLAWAYDENEMRFIKKEFGYAEKEEPRKGL